MIPPGMRIVYDEDAEKQVIGAMIEYPMFIPAAMKMLDNTSFYRVPHQIMYDAITSLYQEHGAIDTEMLAKNLKDNGELNRIGGVEYIHELALTNVVEVIENFEFHCNTIHECYVKRRIEGAMKRGIEQVRSGEQTSDAIMGQIQTMMSEIGKNKSSLVTMDDAINEVEDEINQRIANKDAIVSYGSKLIDATLGGIKPNQMVIIAARPSEGKTSLAQCIAVNVALQEKPVLFLSYETSPPSLAKRYIASSSDINYTKLDIWRVEDWWERFGEEFAFAKKQIEGKPLFFDYSQAYIEEVFGVVHQFKMTYPEAALVIVDYMQIIPSSQKGLSEYERVSLISNTLTRIARKLDLCVIAISQMSRSIARRGEQTPMLSDLRSSGQLEQDADVVLFVWRPGRFDEAIDPHQTELIVAKNRNGALGNIPLKFYPEKFLFKDN